MENLLHLSEDGSHTVYSQKYQAHYHSLQGALNESIHIFITAGLYYLYRKGIRSINLFEMGFGTGLNAILTSIEAHRYKIHINYYCIESDPIDLKLAESLNYKTLLDLDSQTEQQFLQMHSSASDVPINVHDTFTFQKHIGKIEDYSFDTLFDLVYYDAFAPSCQSHLWEEDIHTKIYHALNKGGVLVSYCTQGKFKRMLQSQGYALDILVGPGRKREMLRAIKG